MQMNLNERAMLLPGSNTAAASPSDLVLKASELLFPLVRSWLAEQQMPQSFQAMQSVKSSARSPARHQKQHSRIGSNGAAMDTDSSSSASATGDWTLLSKETSSSAASSTAMAAGARGPPQPPDTRLMYSLLYLLEYFRFAGSTSDQMGSRLRNELVLDLCVPLVELLWNRVPAKRILQHVVAIGYLFSTTCLFYCSDTV